MGDDDATQIHFAPKDAPVTVVPAASDEEPTTFNAIADEEATRLNEDNDATCLSARADDARDDENNVQRSNWRRRHYGFAARD